MAITTANVHSVHVCTNGTVRVVESGSVVTVLSPLTSAADKATLAALIGDPALNKGAQREAAASLSTINNVGFLGRFV